MSQQTEDRSYVDHSPEVDPDDEQDLEEILAEVVMSREEFRGTRRTRPLHSKRLAVYRRLRLMGFSFPVIGRLADRHHSTVLVALRDAKAP